MHTRPNVWPILAVLLLLLPASCLGQQPPIKALMKYIDASRPMACPMPAPISDEFKALSARTLQLKQMVAMIQAGLQDLEEKEIKRSTTARLANLAAALHDANGTAGQEATICPAADRVAAIVQNPTVEGIAAVPPEKVLLDRTVMRFPITEVGVAAAEDQFSISNADKTTGALSIVGEPKIFEVDANGKPKPDESKNFKVTQMTGTCSSAMATGQNCQVHVGFTPKFAGELNAEAKVRVRMVTPGKDQAPGTVAESEELIPIAGEGYVKDIAGRNGDGDRDSTPSFRITAGLDAAGSTNSQVQQKYYLDVAVNAPVGWSRTRIDPLNRGYWWFFNPRLTSVPKAPTALSNLNVQGFADILNDSGNKTDLVQGVDVQGGIEACPSLLHLRKLICTLPREGVPFFTSYRNMHAKIGIFLVAGGGFTTPFASQVNNPTVFSLADSGGNFPGATGYKPFCFANPNFSGKAPTQPTACPTAGDTLASTSPLISSGDSFFSGKQAFAFVLNDRSRFYRKYFVGYRLKTYHFTDLVQGNCDADWTGKYATPVRNEAKRGVWRDCEGVHNAYPGVIDLTVGQDEQVTGGHLHGWVFRLDANYPLPFAPYAHVLITVNSAFEKNQVSLPFVPPATSTLALGSPSVSTVPVSVFPRRDLYRVGIGFDLLEIKSALTKKTPDTTQKPMESTTDKASGASDKAKPGTVTGGSTAGTPGSTDK